MEGLGGGEDSVCEFEQLAADNTRFGTVRHSTESIVLSLPLDQVQAECRIDEIREGASAITTRKYKECADLFFLNQNAISFTRVLARAIGYHVYRYQGNLLFLFLFG